MLKRYCVYLGLVGTACLVFGMNSIWTLFVLIALDGFCSPKKPAKKLARVQDTVLEVCRCGRPWPCRLHVPTEETEKPFTVGEQRRMLGLA